ncbi:S41 family peptidase [Enterococcus sp. 2201sp1_2201st1_B8_2201SCRN_220225]|uniref:S41 family peptidase n=1 Tax=unclassified Enterococcus TaxID=2608891 RepID=UPI0034A1E83B
MKKAKKFTTPQFVISLILVAVLFGAAGFFYAQILLTKQKNNEDELAAVHQLYETIQGNYYQEVESKTLIQGALKGMTESLDDPYSNYLDASGAEELDQSLSDSFEGIGASLTQKDNWPVIAQTPIAGTPADKAGLQANDFILAVDNVTTEGLSLDEVVGKIRGKKGSKIALTIKREQDTFDVSVIRDVIPVETVYGKLDEKEPTVGYLQITTFGEGTAEELKTAIQDLRKKGAKSFVLDVRQNPGGLLDAVQEMASMFLADGQVIVQFEDNQGNKTKTVASETLDGGFKVKEEVVVLVDGNSASAAEIFAAALKESGQREIIGTTTFGKGTMQQVADLDDESDLKLTVAKWLTPDGTWLHEKGLEPTIKADYPSFAYLPPISRSADYQLNDSGQEIDYLNQFLAALGYETKGEKFDETTKDAIEAIQQSHKLEVSGVLNKETADAIEAELTASLKGQDFAYQTGVAKLIEGAASSDEKRKN